MKLVRVKRKDEEFSDLFNSYEKEAPEIKRAIETIKGIRKRLDANIFFTGDYRNATEKEKKIWKMLVIAYDAMNTATFNLGDAWHLIQGAKR